MGVAFLCLHSWSLELRCLHHNGYGPALGVLPLGETPFTLSPSPAWTEVAPFLCQQCEVASQAILQGEQSKQHIPFLTVSAPFAAWRSSSGVLRIAGYTYFLLMIPEADCGFGHASPGKQTLRFVIQTVKSIQKNLGLYEPATAQ